VERLLFLVAKARALRGGHHAPVLPGCYFAASVLIGMRDANGNLTRWRFDNAGQLQAELQADGGIVTHQYDAFGNKVAIIDARCRASMRCRKKLPLQPGL
jgi:YD repeat-containing protein